MPKKRTNNGNEQEDDGPPDNKKEKHEQGRRNASSSSDAPSPRSLRSRVVERGRESKYYSPSCVIQQQQPTTSSQTPQPASNNPNPSPPQAPSENPFDIDQLKILPDSADDGAEFEKITGKDGLRGLLVWTQIKNDKDWPYGSHMKEPRLVCTLAVQVGTADDPEKTPGMARLVERLYAGVQPPGMDRNFGGLDDPSASVTFKGETHEDVTFYTCVIKQKADDGSKETLKERLVKQFKRFNVNCAEAYPDEDIKAEIERILQEYETYRGKGWLRFEELTRTFHHKKIPNRNFLWGNRSTLEAQKWQDFKDDMKKFIQQHYTVTKCVLVVQNVGLKVTDDMGFLGDFLEAVEDELKIMKPPATTSPAGKGASSNQQQTAQQVTTTTQQCAAAAPTYPSFLNSANFNQVYYVQPTAYEDKICLSWCIDYDKDEKKHSEVKPLLYVEALLKLTTPGSLIENLIGRQLITSVDTLIFPRCPAERLENIPVSAIWPAKNKAYLFTIVLSLTREGVKNANDVIATVIRYIQKLEAKTETYDQIQRLRKGRIRAFGAVRRPEERCVKIAYSVLFPQAWNVNILTDDISMHAYNDAEKSDAAAIAEIQRVLKTLKSPDQVNVVLMAHLSDEDEIWKSLKIADFQSPDGINLGFQYGRKAVDESEKTKWYDPPSESTFRMPTQEELYDPKEKEKWEEVCQKNCKRLLLLGGPRPEEEDSDIFESDTDKDEGRRMSIRLDHFYIAHSIVHVQIWQPKYLVHQEPSGGYSKKPFPRALWLLLGEMIRIKSQLGGLTLANRECSVVSVEVDRVSGLNVSIHGLHTWTLFWFNSLFDWLSNLEDAFKNMRATIFDSAKSKLEADIHNPERLCEDLTLRGILLGHDPLIECYDLLVHLEKSNELVTYLQTFLAEMQVTVYVRTNVPIAWGDSGITSKFRSLPKYKPNKPRLAGEKEEPEQPTGALTLAAAAKPSMLDDSFYSMSDLRTYYVASMKSPNPATHLCCVRKTYQLKPGNATEETLKTLNVTLGLIKTNVWMEFAYGSAPLTYKPQVGLDLSDPDLPCLFIQITSDRRHAALGVVSKRIDDLIQKISNEFSASHSDEGVRDHFTQLLKPADLNKDPDTVFRLYEVQVDGDGQATTSSAKGNAYLPAPDYSRLKRYDPGSNTYSADEQIAHLTTGGRGDVLNDYLGNDIKKGIRPAQQHNN